MASALGVNVGALPLSGYGGALTATGSALGGVGTILGTAGVLAAAGYGINWLLKTKESNATLSSTGDSTNGTTNNVASNLPNSTTTNNSTINGTDQSWWNKASDVVSSGTQSVGNWWNNQSLLNKVLLTTAGVGIGTPLLMKAFTGQGKSENKSDNKNTNANTTTNNNNPSTSSHNEFQFENENEVDYTPSSFHNFVPSINVNTSPVKPVIEINPKSAIFIPYERGHKSVPKTRNNRFDYDWMFKNVRSPGFSNI